MWEKESTKKASRSINTRGGHLGRAGGEGPRLRVALQRYQTRTQIEGDERDEKDCSDRHSKSRAACDGRDILLVYLKADPTFDSLRSDLRFADLGQRVSPPE
jgi:hypothetical protein